MWYDIGFNRFSYDILFRYEMRYDFIGIGDTYNLYNQTFY